MMSGSPDAVVEAWNLTWKHIEEIAALWAVLGIPGVITIAHKMLHKPEQAEREPPLTLGQLIKFWTMVEEKRLVHAPPAVAAPKPTPLEDESAAVHQAVEVLSKLRLRLKPEELTPQMFPRGLNVIAFEAGKQLRIRWAVPRALALIGAFWSFPIYVFLIGGILEKVLGSFWVGAVVGILVWMWRMKKGYYVSINFEKKKFAIVTPYAGSWSPGLPVATISKAYRDNMWHVVLTLQGMNMQGVPVVARQSSEVDGYDDLRVFAQVLNWQCDHPIEVAPGVLITP